MKTIKLYNGVEMPEVGFGTWKAPNSDVTANAVKVAIETGFHHIDAAAIYGNESEVGRGIKESGIKREDLFLTSKLWNTVRGYDETMAAFNQTISDLGVDYLDLYLIHWPIPVAFKENAMEKNVESWKAMEDLYKAGKIRAIGVSNFKVHHLEEFIPQVEIKPMVNQIEFHPSLTQDDIRAYCEKNEIVVQGYSPLANGRVFKDAKLLELADSIGKPLANVCVRYALEKKVVPLVKSVTPERIKANFDWDFDLSQAQLAAIDAVTSCEGSGVDSDNINF